MKISIVITDITRRGGTEKATFNLLAGLLNKGVEAKVISLFKESSYTQENSEKISYLVSGGMIYRMESYTGSKDCYKQFGSSVHLNGNSLET